MAPGLDAVAYVHKRIDSFAARWRDSYPAAVHALLADRESLTVYLRFPREHWTRVRHSNFIERTFGESRRRVKVIGRLPGEHSCLKLVWAVLDRASAGWRGFTRAPAPRPTPLTARTPGPTAPTPPPRHRSDTTRNCQRHRITSTASSGAHVRAFYTAPGTPPTEHRLTC